MSERFQRVRSIFERAIELEGASREAWLEEACGEDATLLAEVRGMLDADASGDSFLDGDARNAFGAAAALDDGLTQTRRSDAPDSPRPPEETIGPYRLLEKLGEGGMGEVWLAEQRRPVERKVALKIIKAGLDSGSVLARFSAERQALALMDDPAIARVYDAGTTASGRPYFVMEHIRGLPISKHCDRERLTTRQRLELMLQVCEGVQHAHQRGIIHRDLKPSNVLVTLDGERSTPKIIDFGVAKATARRLTDQTLHTVVGEMIGTPEYMSPEQADLTEQDIDVRTDVYALGVMLYELLTGTLPFDSRDLRMQSFDEIRRRIREVDPQTPSTRFGTLGGDLTTETASARRTNPVRLRRELKGDLDWIVMRALEKDRARRYASPMELAADIRRHLADEPVLAGPPSVRYRVGKFVRRHRVAVSFAALVAIALVAFAVTMGLQAQRLAREKERTAAEAYRFNLLAVKGEMDAARMTSAGEFLDATPVEMRGWEWRHLMSRLDQSVARFEAPRAAPSSIAVSADGRTFVTATEDDGLLLRDLETGAVILTMQAPGVPYSWAMSRDGRELHATGGGPDSQRWLASWSLPDGRLRSSVALEVPLHLFKTSTYAWAWAVFDVDRRRVVVHGAESHYEVIDLDHPTRRVIRTFDGPRRLHALSRSGDRIAVMGDPFAGTPEILILDSATLETRRRLAGHHDMAIGTAISPDGSRLATTSMDGRLQQWDLAGPDTGNTLGQALYDIDGQQGEVRAVRYSEDGTLLITAGQDRTIHLREAATGTTLWRLATQHQVVAMDLVEETGELASLNLSGIVQVWATRQPGPDVLAGHHSFVYAVDVDRELGLILSGGWDGFEGRPGCVRLWDLASGDPVVARGDPSKLTMVAKFVPGERAALASFSDVPSAGVATARLHRIDLDTGSERRIHEVSAILTALAPSRRSRGAWGMTIQAEVKWIDTEAGTESILGSFPIVPSPSVAWKHQVAVSPDERTLAIASSDGTLGLYRAADLEPVLDLPVQDAPVHSLAFDPAGRRLVSASEGGTVSVWNVRDGREIARLVGHDLGVLCARFDPSGTRIASGGRDGTLRIWNAETYVPLIALTGHDSYVHDLWWGDDGETIVTASGDHTLRIWETRPVRERYSARRERQEIVERLTPRIEAWLSSSRDPAPVRFLETAPDLSDRERQVARQILLGRALGQPGSSPSPDPGSRR